MRYFNDSIYLLLLKYIYIIAIRFRKKIASLFWLKLSNKILKVWIFLLCYSVEKKSTNSKNKII